MDLDLMAPIQLENLLPYNLQYRIYNKNTEQYWRSYLRAGGIMPIHSVELNNLVILNIEINDTGSLPSLRRLGKLIVSSIAFQASEYSIINTDRQSDFGTETRLTLQDAHSRKLDLRLNYVWVLFRYC